VEKILQTQINQFHLRNGVKIENIENAKIDWNVKIGKETIIEEGVELKGNTIIGEKCEIRKGSIIINTSIPDDTKIGENTYIKDAVLG
jgi:bifunctional UDP-N-acetylglucosamine pyrophosphorylase/glucosamine-1-phosphate N-acetyltransferase